jgi:type IV pilus assembly protein PilA
LIVVIAILGILIAIAVPRFSQVSESAETTANKATARTILSAITMAEVKTQSDAPTEEDINEFLNDPITLAITDPDGSGTGWQVFKDGDTWKVFNDGEQILP